MVIRKHITVLSYSLFVLAQVLFAITVIARPAQAQRPSGIGNLTKALGLERLIPLVTGTPLPWSMGLVGSREKPATLCRRVPGSGSTSAFPQSISATPRR